MAPSKAAVEGLARSSTMPSIGNPLSKQESYYDAPDNIQSGPGEGFRQLGRTGSEKVGICEPAKADKKRVRKSVQVRAICTCRDHQDGEAEDGLVGQEDLQVDNSFEQGAKEAIVSKKKITRSCSHSKPPRVNRRNVGVQVNMGTTSASQPANREPQNVRSENSNGEEIYKTSLPAEAADVTCRDNAASSASNSTSSSSVFLRGSEVDSASSPFLATAEVDATSGVDNADDGVPEYTVPRSVRSSHVGRPDDELEALMPQPFPNLVGQSGSDLSDINLASGQTLSPTIGARNRWRRLAHTVAFANHMAHIRSPAGDLLENRVEDHLPYHSADEDGGGEGAAAFEGAETAALRWKPRGRKGMDSMVVKQEKGYLSFIQDFYVACLKMPIGHFLIGVFLAPVALGLFFTPFYLVDMAGLNFEGDPVRKPNETQADSDAAKFMSVFLYSLSLSTTFGGSPVTAVSPLCLLIANVNTLLAQFLFVFLSGAVFARMSQPSHPVRCSKRAVIRESDFVPSADESKERFRALAVRLVLTGPPPCELVDAKICLIFRIFIRLPTGSMFCSTQNLHLLRSEVSYLRYGIMVRHIIDTESPIYGHTMETLKNGDASFSLTIMALERTSMQPIFHLEDYFVHDGDIVWDGDYEDFISVNAKGHRVLDHSKIDSLRHPLKVAGIVAQAVSRMEGNVTRRKAPATGPSDAVSTELGSADKQSAQEEQEEVKFETPAQAVGLDSPGEYRAVTNWVTGLRNRKLWETKSASFTRATSDRGVTRLIRND